MAVVSDSIRGHRAPPGRTVACGGPDGGIGGGFTRPYRIAGGTGCGQNPAAAGCAEVEDAYPRLPLLAIGALMEDAAPRLE